MTIGEPWLEPARYSWYLLVTGINYCKLYFFSNHLQLDFARTGLVPALEKSSCSNFFTGLWRGEQAEQNII